MTYDEWVRTYNGKAIDYDHAYGVQCVDLAKLYIDKVLGLNPQSIGNAEAYWRRYDELSYLHDNFHKIPNTPTLVPQKGDVAVWDSRHGKYGHIAVATGEGTTSWFNSWDQNWGGKGQGMTKIKHTYKSGFAGVLRPKAQDKVNGNSYNQGQDVEIHVPIAQTGAVQGQNVQVESDTIQNPETGSKQFWINQTVIKNGQIIARAKICAVQDRIMVQVFDSQFWIKEKDIAKAL